MIEDVYKIQKGDTLWDIAKRVYGDGSMYKKLAIANNISDPDKIYAGNGLILPSKEFMDNVKVPDNFGVKRQRFRDMKRKSDSIGLTNAPSRDSVTIDNKAEVTPNNDISSKFNIVNNAKTFAEKPVTPKQTTPIDENISSKFNIVNNARDYINRRREQRQSNVKRDLTETQGISSTTISKPRTYPTQVYTPLNNITLRMTRDEQEQYRYLVNKHKNGNHPEVKAFVNEIKNNSNNKK